MKIRSFIRPIILFLPILLHAQQPEITVTSQNLALIKETRSFSVKAGLNTVTLRDLPELLDPSSVLCIFSANSIQLTEQRFAYDLRTILKKSTNQSIRYSHPQLGVIQGRLLSAHKNSLVIETTDGEIRLIPDYTDGQVTFEKPASDSRPYITEPTLFWQIQSQRSATTEVVLHYLTEGLGWHADYAAMLNKDETELILSGLVTIYNNSGKSFHHALLTLIAGDINLVKKSLYSDPLYRSAGQANELHDLAVEPQKAFDYYHYRLPVPVSIDDRQEKQFPLFDVRSLKIKKSYYYNYQKDAQNVAIIMLGKNTKEDGPGIVLPSGRVRIYQKTDKRRLILGVDKIPNISLNEQIRIEVGKAFDLQANRTILNRQRESNQSEKQQIAIKFNNRKNEDVSINVIEPIPAYRSYRILSHNIDVYKKDARQIEFIITVQAGQSNTLNYEILYTR